MQRSYRSLAVAVHSNQISMDMMDHYPSGMESGSPWFKSSHYINAELEKDVERVLLGDEIRAKAKLMEKKLPLLELSVVKGNDVVCIIKNSATLTGSLFTLHASQINLTYLPLRRKTRRLQAHGELKTKLIFCHCHILCISLNGI